MTNPPAKPMPVNRRFLLLQGPHGPFFRQLGRALRQAGVQVRRVGFNAGDAAFWGRAPGYLPYRGGLADWPAALQDLLDRHAITDIVLYGDTRPIHAAAIRVARAKGLRIHIFEEGYLRPYWVSYERGGSNGHSALMNLSLEDMRARLSGAGHDVPPPPAQWGDMRQHVFYGALYHWCVMFRNAGYPGFAPHRALPVRREAALYTRRLLLMPFLTLHRIWATRRILARGHPYNLVLLQLEHDASFQAHSDFPDMRSFIDVVMQGFAAGAPAHHHLVFKAHPLESGQSPLRRIITDAARAHGVAGRIHYLHGGKLAYLLDQARSAVTVNSTSGQQALWRGIPLRAFGRVVYDKPEFLSHQPLPRFFARPDRPDTAAYRLYRQFLLETSQLPGGYYSARGRRQLLRQVIDRMLAADGPYEMGATPPAMLQVAYVG